MSNVHGFGKITLADADASPETTGTPTYPVFLGSEASFYFNLYHPNASHNAVYIKQQFSDTVAITAGVASTSAGTIESDEEGEYHHNTAEDFLLMEGFTLSPPRVQYYSLWYGIEDRQNATHITTGVRMKFKDACALMGGCRPLPTDTLMLEPFTIYRGAPHTITGSGPKVLRSEWGDGFPVILSSGFGAARHLPSDGIDIIVYDNKKYIASPTLPLNCGIGGCNTVNDWNNSPNNRVEWDWSGYEEENPVKVFIRTPYGIIHPPRHDTGDIIVRDSWSVCLGHVVGTPCELPRSMCDKVNHPETGWPDATDGPWYCLKFDANTIELMGEVLPEFRDRSDCTTGEWVHVNDAGPCGACSRLKFPNANGMIGEATALPVVDDFDIGAINPRRAAIKRYGAPFWSSCQSGPDDMIWLRLSDGSLQKLAFADHSSGGDWYVERYASTCSDIISHVEHQGFLRDDDTDMVYTWAWLSQQDFTHDCPY